MKEFFSEAASALAPTDPKGAARLAAASTHWLRHTHGTHSTADGVGVDVIQSNLGHASLATTTIYVRAELKRRVEALEAFAAKRISRGLA
ncbi:MAG: tyrosine-type recombinase/integrase [Burkholderiales bacterium]